MPEIITKYPDIALKILKDAHIKCGEGEKQQILTSCPKENFCALPTGELCIYGVKEIPSMSQIHSAEFFLLPNMIFPLLSLMVMTFLLGVVVGMRLKK